MATNQDARLNFRLPLGVKEDIERAAAARGQSVSDFAVSILARKARAVNRQFDVTVLSDRDRDRFLGLLDDVEATPNAALARAADRYKQAIG